MQNVRKKISIVQIVRWVVLIYIKRHYLGQQHEKHITSTYTVIGKVFSIIMYAKITSI